MDKKTKSCYFKNNKIRTKLLLFIDNEIQFKIKQKTNNLKFNCENENQTKISFEETFTQKYKDKYNCFTSSIFKKKKNDNSDKSFSTIDDSNKIIEKPHKRGNTHSKTHYNNPNKLFNNVIYYDKKIYSIKNISRQSSTFLILPKQKKAAEYLKILCNNLKMDKNDKKIAKQFEAISCKNNSFFLKKIKSTQKSSKVNIPKYNNHALFRKSQTKNSIILNTKNKITRKSTNNMILIKFKQNV